MARESTYGVLTGIIGNYILYFSQLFHDCLEKCLEHSVHLIVFAIIDVILSLQDITETLILKNTSGPIIERFLCGG